MEQADKRQDAYSQSRSILGAEEMRRTLTRIAHEILERNRGVGEIVLIGIHTGGVPIAQRLAALIQNFEGAPPPLGSLDIGLYRDDLADRNRPLMHPTEIPVSIEGRLVILVDDVFYTGRTIRAAMDALNDFGRPRRVQLAVLVDRGHRELPIKADYVGKNVPTALDEVVQVCVAEIDGFDEALLLSNR